MQGSKQSDVLFCGVLVALSLFLTGCPDPDVAECPQDECYKEYCDQSQNRVVYCNCYDNYPNGGYGRTLDTEAECAPTETCAVLAQGNGTPDWVAGGFRGDARCLAQEDPCVADPSGPTCPKILCTTPAAVECRPVDGALAPETYWHACAGTLSSTFEVTSMVSAYRNNLSPAEVEPGQFYVWHPTSEACTLCASDCTCGWGEVCSAEGSCVRGELPSGSYCCNRTDCVAGQACENPDGSQAVCP